MSGEPLVLITRVTTLMNHITLSALGDESDYVYFASFSLSLSICVPTDTTSRQH